MTICNGSDGKYKDELDPQTFVFKIKGKCFWLAPHHGWFMEPVETADYDYTINKYKYWTLDESYEDHGIAERDI